MAGPNEEPQEAAKHGNPPNSTSTVKLPSPADEKQKEAPVERNTPLAALPPRAEENLYSLSGISQIQLQPNVSVTPTEKRKVADAFAAHGNEFAKAHNFHELLGELERKAKASGDMQMADRFLQMKNSVRENRLEDINSFRAAQRELTMSHGLYVDPPFEASSLSQRVIPVKEVCTYHGTHGSKHPVYLVESTAASQQYGRFTPYDLAVVDISNASKAPGERALIAVMANELAHSYLTSRGFLAYPDRFVSTDSISTSQYPPHSPAGEAIALLKSQGRVSQMAIHELVSDSWSTSVSPSFDQHRLLSAMLQVQSTEQAFRELGKSTGQHHYDLTFRVFHKITENTLKQSDSPNLLQERIDALTQYHKKFMLLGDRLKSDPHNQELRSEQRKVNEQYGVEHQASIEMLKTALGEKGLLAQSEAFLAIRTEGMKLVLGDRK